ncbi:MAG TPA: TonB family protein [Paracoccus sp.]|nr:TonB family protein [Paracoccus sp. (in: a-proteobacteria)]
MDTPTRTGGPPAGPAKAGQGGQMQASPEATGGGGGISPQQLARIEASWRQQIGACMARSVSRVSGGRGARMAVNFVVGRNGRVQGASLNGSSGDARVDQQVLRAVRRARCPAAPPSLAQRQLSFQQPFAIR